MSGPAISRTTTCVSMPSIEPDGPPAVHVAVGVVIREQRVLVSWRAEHLHQGGLWEFPGGKLEPGESVLDALRREFAEELGLRVGAARAMLTVAHDYGDKRVLLDVWRIADWEGEPRGLEGQPLQWAAIDSLHELAFPAANEPIVLALQQAE